mgnify:FL=1|jgi:hypothetical protein
MRSALVLLCLAATISAAQNEPFLPAQGLSFARERAIAETGDTGVALVSIQWMKYRADSIQAGTLDLQGNGALPVWDYIFLSPSQEMIHLFTVISAGGNFQVVGHKQWPKDTSRVINKSWYDIDSLMNIIPHTVEASATGWKTVCPEIEVARLRLVMYYDPYINRSYVPMWGVEWWCVPQRFRLECFHDAYRRAITICSDTSSLVSSVAMHDAPVPMPEKLLLTDNTVPLRTPLSMNSTMRIFDISGRLIEEKHLPAGTESIALPSSISQGIYRILITDSNGNLVGSLFVVRIE